MKKRVILRNIGPFDRFFRSLLAESIIVAGFFWLAGIESIFAFIAGFALLFSALFGFSVIYAILGYSSYKEEYETSRIIIAVLIIFSVFFLVAISYESDRLTKESFAVKISALDEQYTLLLSATLRDNREGSANAYEQMVLDLKELRKDYAVYRPFFLRSDPTFEGELAEIETILNEVKTQIYSGDLNQTHYTLRPIRQIFSNMNEHYNLTV